MQVLLESGRGAPDATVRTSSGLALQGGSPLEEGLATSSIRPTSCPEIAKPEDWGDSEAGSRSQ